MSVQIDDFSPVRDVRVAVAFLTRMPTGRIADLATSDLARAAWAFPVAGLIVGLLAGGALYLANMTDISPIACALIALAVQAVVTGALHEDGLADVADGFGAYEKDKILTIMRDSRIGSYGVLALIFSVAIRTTMIAGIPGAGLAFACMVAAAAISRGVLPMIMARMSPARDDGLSRDAGMPTLQGAAIALGIGVFVLFTLLPLSVALAALVIGTALTAVILLWAQRRLGGQTGDVLGAVQQVFEIAVLSAAAGWSSVFYE